ncbi:MAG: hypothetical protein ACREXS_02600 [Gammaproteobacteria bacterium]
MTNFQIIGRKEKRKATSENILPISKPPFARKTMVANGITRVPVSVTSSLLRLPLALVKAVLERVRDPVLFVHPWELIDMSGTGIRLDCRFNTGEPALATIFSQAQTTRVGSEG